MTFAGAGSENSSTRSTGPGFLIISSSNASTWTWIRGRSDSMLPTVNGLTNIRRNAVCSGRSSRFIILMSCNRCRCGISTGKPGLRLSALNLRSVSTVRMSS
jgi:hypothetical protein